MMLFFGGSFDPVHVGHLIVARDVLEVVGASRVVFLPAYQAPLKEAHRASPEDRLNMLRLATKGQEGFEVSPLEIERGGVSYTVDTAEELSKRLGYRPTFVVGADSFLKLHMWKEPEKLLQLARFVVIDRGGREKEVVGYIKERFPNLKEGEDYTLVRVRRIDISSTEIRQRLAEGKSVRWLVPPEVEAYIYERKLYRNP